MELKVGNENARPNELSPTRAESKGRSTRGKVGDGGVTAINGKDLKPVLFEAVPLAPKDEEEVESKLRVVQLLLQRSKPKEALEIIEKALPKCPDHVQLITSRGQCYMKLGNAPAAFACFSSALKLDSGHVEALMGLGTLYKAKEMLPECVEVVATAHGRVPGDKEVSEAYATALTDLGTKLKNAGQINDAIAKYLKALAVCETYAPAYYNLGVVYTEMGSIERAVEHYEKAVEFQQSNAMAWCNMGLIYKDKGNLEVAIQCYEKALLAQPNCAVVHQNLAAALSEFGTKIKLQGKIQEGIAAYEKALSHNPKCVDALYNLGVAYSETGQFDKAIFMYETAIANKEFAEAYNNLGAIYKERDNMERAVQCYMAALNIKPNFPQSLNNLGVVYTAEGRAQEAMALLQAAVAAAPNYAEAFNNIGVLQRDVGLIKDAITSYEKCLELCKGSRNAGQNRLLGLNYIHHGEESLVCDGHKKWGEEFQKGFERLPTVTRGEWDTTPNRPLRVGYISPDLYTHSVSYFAEAPLAHHNQDRVHHIVYNCSPKVDGKTIKLRCEVETAGGEWRDTGRLTELELAETVRKDKIDILVELTGQFANNRLGTMAMKPAPIQVSWIGYPNSTGLQAVDYRFTDELCDPVDTEQTFVEELIRLPGCFLCYTPMNDAPPVAPAPCLENGFITFGSFNALAKITTDVIKVWAKLLRAVPDSRLVLKNKPLACETTKNYFLNLFKAEGIESWRLDLLPLAPQTHQHLSLYSLIDISLDPWPYAGTTTTCESMYMGVPCITLAGGCHAHNVGVSLLSSVGLEEGWIANSVDEYIMCGIHHSKDLQNLAEVRAGLRDQMLASRLCDPGPFVASLEDVYRELWVRWLKQGSQSELPEASSNLADKRALSMSSGGSRDSQTIHAEFD